jgi:hypothetical protein
MAPNEELTALAGTPPWEWPRNAGEKLQAILRGANNATADRVAAAELAGTLVVMDETMAALLLAIVLNSGEPEELRGQAAISLGPVLDETDNDEDEFDGPTPPPISKAMFDGIRNTLRDVFGDERNSKLVRRRVLEAAVRSPQDWHRQAIREAAASADAEWQLTAAFCMGYVPGFDDEIVAMLDSRKPEIVRQAVEAAGNFQVGGAWPKVKALLKARKTERSLLLTAIGAAAFINSEEAIDLLEPYSESPDEEIAEAASEALWDAEAGPEVDSDEDWDEDSHSPLF